MDEKVVMDEMKLLVGEWLMELIFKTQHHVEKPSLALCIQLKALKLYLQYIFR